MTEHNLFYYPYASFTNAQLPRLKGVALYFDKLVILDSVGASWATIGADHHAREAVKQLKDAGILQRATAVRLARRQEDRTRERPALSVELMNGLRNNHVPRGE